MNDALRVTMLKSFEQIYHNFGRLLFIEWLLPLGDFLKQLTTRAKLHAKVNVFGIIVGLIILDDVRMVNLLHELNLIFQTLEILGVQFRLVDNLDCYLHRFVFLIVGPEHLSVRA